jgi:hypothetical protein
LGVSFGRRVRVGLLDDGGHQLDSRTYIVPPTEAGAVATG